MKYTNGTQTIKDGDPIEVDGRMIIPNRAGYERYGYNVVEEPYEPPTPEPLPEPTPSELRQQAYINEPLIAYEDKILTIDEAKSRWVELMSEGDADKADGLRELIAVAKAEVRGRDM